MKFKISWQGEKKDFFLGCFILLTEKEIVLLLFLIWLLLKLRPFFTFLSVLDITKYGKSKLRKSSSHMAEMPHSDWLEPRGLEQGRDRGNLGPICWNALFFLKITRRKNGFLKTISL